MQLMSASSPGFAGFSHTLIDTPALFLSMMIGNGAAIMPLRCLCGSVEALPEIDNLHEYITMHSSEECARTAMSAALSISNLTVEIPLKATVRGFSWIVIPITWRHRGVDAAKMKIKEMGSRYLFICLYVWLEKYFSRGDYKKQIQEGSN